MTRMKRINLIIITIVLVLSTLMLTACGKSEFGVTENNEKQMTITAQNADKDAFFTVGSLEADKNEKIVITSGLTKGMVKVEIVPAPKEQSEEVLPKTDGDAIITANVDISNGASGTVPAGTYMLRATCLEKATGTITVEVMPAP